MKTEKSPRVVKNYYSARTVTFENPIVFAFDVSESEATIGMALQEADRPVNTLELFLDINTSKGSITEIVENSINKNEEHDD